MDADKWTETEAFHNKWNYMKVSSEKRPKNSSLKLKPAGNKVKQNHKKYKGRS